MPKKTKEHTMENGKKAKKQEPIVSAQNEQQIIGRPDIPTLYIDKFMFAKRSDGYIIVSGVQDIPSAGVEQLRFMMTADHAKCFLDRLAGILDYFPVKEDLQQKKPAIAKQTKRDTKKKQTSK